MDRQVCRIRYAQAGTCSNPPLTHRARTEMPDSRIAFSHKLKSAAYLIRFRTNTMGADSGESGTRTALATAANTASDGRGVPGPSDRIVLVEEPCVAQPYEHSVIRF